MATVVVEYSCHDVDADLLNKFKERCYYKLLGGVFDRVVVANTGDEAETLKVTVSADEISEPMPNAAFLATRLVMEAYDDV